MNLRNLFAALALGAALAIFSACTQTSSIETNEGVKRQGNKAIEQMRETRKKLAEKKVFVGDRRTPKSEAIAQSKPAIEKMNDIELTDVVLLLKAFLIYAKEVQELAERADVSFGGKAALQERIETATLLEKLVAERLKKYAINYKIK